MLKPFVVDPVSVVDIKNEPRYEEEFSDWTKLYGLKMPSAYKPDETLTFFGLRYLTMISYCFELHQIRSF